jgi:hypothetical protein
MKHVHAQDRRSGSGRNMTRFLPCVLILALCWSQSARAQGSKSQAAPANGGDFSNNVEPGNKVPAGVILVKGAWASASDSVTPVPEGVDIQDSVLRDPYFGITYPLPADWEEKYKGPPPSESGRYVLGQLSPASTFKGADRGTILITAQDMFFIRAAAGDASDLINYSKNHLQADYKLEMAPTPTKIAGRPFIFYAYWSPVAELHWYLVTTEIRCHAVQIVLSSRNTKLLENLVLDLDRMKLPTEASPTGGKGGGDVPVCIKDYANGENTIARVDPVFSEHKFNSVPVRIIIDKEGKVKHIHFLSAFPDQAKAITDAMAQWRFKRYLRDGKPVQVETGIMFGRNPYPKTGPASSAATE